jgi:hypothetical protein
MSYHLTILRSTNGKQIPILLEDVKTAAHQMGNWEFTDSPPTFTFTLPQGEITMWYETDEGEIWAKSQGEIWELYPMIALANSLNARVRGDEFETYETADKTYFHPDDEPIKKECLRVTQHSLKEQRRIRNVIIGFFIILGIIAFIIGKQFEQ